MTFSEKQMQVLWVRIRTNLEIATPEVLKVSCKQRTACISHLGANIRFSLYEFRSSIRGAPTTRHQLITQTSLEEEITT